MTPRLAILYNRSYINCAASPPRGGQPLLQNAFCKARDLCLWKLGLRPIDQTLGKVGNTVPDAGKPHQQVTTTSSKLGPLILEIIYARPSNFSSIDDFANSNDLKT